MTDEHPNEIAFQCTCGKTLVVPSDSEGRQAKCPHCNAIVTVPTATDEPIADATPTHEQTEDGPPQATCPMCKAAIDATDVTCATCGFQVRSATAAAAGRAAKSAGALMLGCVFSGLGALIGAAIWSGVAIASDYEFGWIAWGLGGLAGLGMHLGYRAGGRVAGAAAVTCALVGILVAKGVLFGYVMYGVFSGNTDRYDFQRLHVTVQIANEILVERDAYNEADREREWPSAMDEAQDRVAAMSKAEVVEKWESYQAANAALHETASADDGNAPDPNAYAQEWDRERLADHRANRQANAQGLAYTDEQRTTLYDQQVEAARAMSDDELQAAIAELDAWEAGGKWADADYVRDYLILADLMDAEDANDANTPPWATRYQAAAQRVDAMDPNTQLAQAKAIEANREQQRAEAWARFEEESAQRGKQAWIDLVKTFFQGAFNGMDIVFIALAMMTSYRIGNGQMQTEKG